MLYDHTVVPDEGIGLVLQDKGDTLVIGVRCEDEGEKIFSIGRKCLVQVDQECNLEDVICLKGRVVVFDIANKVLRAKVTHDEGGRFLLVAWSEGCRESTLRIHRSTIHKVCPVGETAHNRPPPPPGTPDRIVLPAEFLGKEVLVYFEKNGYVWLKVTQCTPHDKWIAVKGPEGLRAFGPNGGSNEGVIRRREVLNLR